MSHEGRVGVWCTHELSTEESVVRKTHDSLHKFLKIFLHFNLCLVVETVLEMETWKCVLIIVLTIPIFNTPWIPWCTHDLLWVNTNWSCLIPQKLKDEQGGTWAIYEVNTKFRLRFIHLVSLWVQCDNKIRFINII